MASKIIDLTGQSFGHLKVIEISERRGSNGSPMWRCTCSCGSERIVERANLKRGQSCGCSVKLKFRNNLLSRMEEKFIPEPNSGCWLWFGGISKDGGYGKISVDGRSHKAHRKMFEIYCGSIPNGFEVCHSCDNPCCVNPDHLFVGTHLDNMADRDHKGRRRAPKGTANGYAKLTEEKVRAIRAATGSQKEIAERFGTDQTNVSLILLRKRWSHVT